MARKKLKLYVWHGVLTDWSSGIAFALASSPEEAKQEIMKTGVGDYHWQGLKLDGEDFDEYDEPSGFHLFGGG